MATPVGGAQSAHNPSDSVSGRNQTIPAIPTVNGGGASFDHSRKPSMTVTPAGANFNPNGSAAMAPQNKPNVQFGNIHNAQGGSPAMGNPALAHQGNNSLGVNQLNPNQRAASPQGSPSPIPQPREASGGVPAYGGQGNGMVFGQQGEQNDHSVCKVAPLLLVSTDTSQGQPRPVSSLQFGNHDRRGSSHSMHSDIGGPPTGPGNRNFPPAGRGRGGYAPGGYGQQMPHSPYNSYRGQPNGRGMPSGYPGRGQAVPPYGGSPAMGTRSPAVMHAQPGTPQQMHMNMAPNGMQGPPNAYYFQGPQQQVKPPPTSYPPEPIRGKKGKVRSTRGTGGRGRGGKGPHEGRSRVSSRDPASDMYRPDLPPGVALQSFPDLSPESGNFEIFLTNRSQGIPTQPDPSIQQMYAMNMGYGPMQGAPYGYMPPQSPRPYQQGYPMQPTYSNQGQPPNMSRTSSQMSNAPDRPGSSIGQQPHTPSVSTPSVPSHANARTPSMSQGQKPSSNFTIPDKKKRSAIVIKNPNTGEAVSFSDSNKAPASPAPTPTVATQTPPVPTPPSRTPSAVEPTHTRTESQSAKTEEEKKRSMQEAVKQRIAEQLKQQSKQEEAVEEKAEIDQEASEAAKNEADATKTIAENLEKEAAEAKESAKPAEASEPVDEPVKEEAAAPSKPADNNDIDFDAIEAELAAQEAEEARKEEEYLKKKAAQKEAAAQREKEEAEAFERNIKEMERKAEELEIAREKEREAGNTGDDESKRLFAELKGIKTPASTETPAEATPSGPSGTATPVSDVSMPPPARGLANKRSKASELTLDTKKTAEPPEPSATLKALQSARKLEDLSKVNYPSDIASPNPALNQNAPANRGFKYDKTFLLQFQSIFKEKPSLDWDMKIRDALGEGDSARPSASGRTPSGLGPRATSGRPSAGPGGFSGPMGTFGGGSARPLPPGTTSEQRFQMSNAAMRGNPMANPFPMGRGGMAMGRQPSNNIPGSPRVGGSSRGGSRAESKRGKQGGRHAADEKAMPLTAGMNFEKIETSSTGWKPRSLGQSNLGPPVGGDGHLDPEAVQRKVKAALNKMTPEKFDRIADQILVIAAQSKDESDGRSLRQVIQLTFEKATDEAHWASMYAMFCRKMLESMSPDIKDENVKDKNGNIVTGGNLFRKYLLNRCQEEFERGWKVNLPAPKEGENQETAMMSDEYYEAMAAKRRGLGLVKFIGELFKLQMLTERIMHECVKKLVDYEGVPDEAEIESLTSLLRTIGKQLDDPQSKGQARMDIYFERIKSTIDLPELPSRLRFMLMDVVDLRKHGWVSKDDNKGPKTITEIRAEAERQAAADEAARLAQQANRGRGGPMPMGRGDARSFSGYGVPPPDNSNRVATDDLRRLGARSARNTSNTGGGMGPTLGPRTNSGRRGLGPGSFLSRGADDSGASSRTGTPPANKEKEKKDEASTNAFR
jgi:translation initiation factor 4G